MFALVLSAFWWGRPAHAQEPTATTVSPTETPEATEAPTPTAGLTPTLTEMPTATTNPTDTPGPTETATSVQEEVFPVHVEGEIVAVDPATVTLAEALASLQEAVSLFLEECQRMGTLEAVLEEAGYRRESPTSQRWVPRQPIQVHQLEASFA